MNVAKKPRGFLNEAVWPNRIVIRQDAISDSYAVETRPFARGKFATVRRCRHIETGTDFAAKYLKKTRRSEDVRHELIHEALVLAIAEDCERIVSLKEVFETPTEVILVLEMATGGELQHVLDSEDCLPEASCRQLLLQICEGLEFLHRHHIAHLDIKPANLLLSAAFPQGEAKLCDFGISRLILPGEQIHEIAGTPDYIAPEVLQYEPISLATDIWSVGILTYVLLTGHTPFGGDTKQDTFCNITLGELDFPPELFEDVSPEAIHFITQLVAKDPKKRPTVGDILRHPWLTSSSPSPMSLSITSLPENSKNGSNAASGNNTENNDANNNEECALSQCGTPSTSSMESCESDNEIDHLKTAVLNDDGPNRPESVVSSPSRPPRVPIESPLSHTKTAEQVVEIQESSEEESDSDPSSADEQILITDVTDEPGSQVELEDHSATPIVTDSEDVLSPNASHSNIHVLRKNQRILLNNLAKKELLKPSGSQSSATSRSVSASDVRRSGAVKRRPSRKKAKSKSQSHFCVEEEAARRDTVIERPAVLENDRGPDVRPKAQRQPEAAREIFEVEPPPPRKLLPNISKKYANIEEGTEKTERVDELKQDDKFHGPSAYRKIKVNVIKEGEPVVEEPISDSNASNASLFRDLRSNRPLKEDSYDVESVSSEEARRIETKRIVDEVMREQRPKSPEMSVFDRINQRAAKFMDFGSPRKGFRNLNKSRFNVTDFAKADDFSNYSRSNNFVEDFELRHGELMGRFMFEFPFRKREELGLGKNDLRKVHLREYNAQAKHDASWQYAQEIPLLNGEVRSRCPFSDHLSRFDGQPRAARNKAKSPPAAASDSDSSFTIVSDCGSDIVARRYPDTANFLSDRRQNEAAEGRSDAEEDLSVDAENMWQYQKFIPALHTPTKPVRLEEMSFEERVQKRRQNALRKLANPDDGEAFTDVDSDLISQIMGTDLGDGLPVFRRDYTIRNLKAESTATSQPQQSVVVEDCSDEEDFERPQARVVPLVPLEDQTVPRTSRIDGDSELRSRGFPKTSCQNESHSVSEATRGNLDRMESRLLSKLDEWEAKIKGARQQDDNGDDALGFCMEGISDDETDFLTLFPKRNSPITNQVANTRSRRQFASRSETPFEEDERSPMESFAVKNCSSFFQKTTLFYQKTEPKRV